MAKRFFRTTDGERPELSAIGGISQADLKGYAFPKIFPLLPVTEKSGTVTVVPASLTNAKGSKSRTNGQALSGTAVSMADVSYTAAKYEGRGLIYEDDGAAFASSEAADAHGAELAQRLAWNKVEDDAFQKVFTSARKSAATELADHAVIKTLQKKAIGVRKFGAPCLVMTTDTWLDFVEIPEIRTRLQAFAGAANDIGFLAQDVEKVRAVISTLMGFKNVVLFDSDLVDAQGTYKGIIMVVGLRTDEPGEALAKAKEKAVYGWTACYIPEGADADKPFDMSSFYDRKDKANTYDAAAYLGVTEAFSDGVAATKLADEYTEYVNQVTVQGASQSV